VKNLNEISHLTVLGICRDLGLTKDELEFVEFCLPIENYTSYHEGDTWYRIDLTPPFRGLGQFAKGTWDGLRRLGMLKPTYDMSGSPHADVQAIVALYRDSRSAFKRKFKDKVFTKEVAYAYHNQGAPAAASFLRSGTIAEPDQSDQALGTLRTAWEQING
jgi:hypothetical protein